MNQVFSPRRLPQTSQVRWFGRAQLTLVEHALCPLDSAVSLQPNFVHETTYLFTDGHRNRRKAQVKIGGAEGMSAHDEFYLWGLLALALSQPEPRPEIMATPYYCLRQLGMITTAKRGGREFDLFRSALKRLAGMRYQNDAFYDPIRGEHRAVSFGLLNYSLPLDADSSRVWRFAWDPIFFELAQATGGALSFDLALYRQFDAAKQRLYLYLKKIFWRHEATGRLDLRHLACDVLGFAPDLKTIRLKPKLTRCIGKRSPPDWWRELRKRELQMERQQEPSKAAILTARAAGDQSRTEAREAFARVTEKPPGDLRTAGHSDRKAPGG